MCSQTLALDFVFLARPPTTLAATNRTTLQLPDFGLSPGCAVARSMCEQFSQELERSSSPQLSHSLDHAAQPVLQGQSDLHHQPGLRHLGTSQVRQRTGARFTETINDYLDIFQELQIDSMFHGVFWSSVIYRYRQGSRHAPLLKRGTVASIRTMSDDILRAYGWRIWGEKSGWRSKLVEGEERLLYHKDGPNTR